MAFFLPAATIVLLDQLTKQYFWRAGLDHTLIAGWLNITLIKNAGAAFGLFQGGRAFFIVASVVAVVFIIYMAMRLPASERARRIMLGAILGGAIGNLIDRAIYGEVIDFIQIGWSGHYWPVFNVADMGVSLGATALVAYLLFFSREEADSAGTVSGAATTVDPGE